MVKVAEFSFSMDINSIIPKGLNDENLTIEMIKAGQKVMQSSIPEKGYSIYCLLYTSDAADEL